MKTDDPGRQSERAMPPTKHQDGLIPIEETLYSREELLQGWVSDCPELLPGDQIDKKRGAVQ